MAKSNYRPGSMGAADEKSERRFVIGATIIGLVIAALYVIPNGFYFHQWYKEAGWGWNLAGHGVTGAWLWFVWKCLRQANAGPKESWPNIVLVVGLAAIFFVYAGFSFGR